MNAPVRLEDRYQLNEGRVFMSGTQALARLPLVQVQRDRQAGLHTAGFISGYRGSPLGNYDMELWRIRDLLDAHDVRFVPGVNEELGATAVWGSQQVGMHKGARFDGVFGIWYGKGPGLDRAMDVIKHANAAGTARHGGVLAIVGDDHGAKSSTLPHQSDHNFQAAFVPFLYPAHVGEYVEYGLLGLAMSRFAGTWVGFKATADTVETSATIDLAAEQRKIILPGDADFQMPAGGLSIRPSDVWRDEDTRLQRYKGFAALAFAKANKIDRVIWDSPRPRIGIVTAGKAFADVMEALDELGITQDIARDIGLRIYKVGMPWPLEPDGIRSFATGLEEILVIEEKREFIEHQLRWQLYNWREDVRPRVVGKTDEHGRWLLSPDNELTPGQIAHVIAARIQPYHNTEQMRARLAFFAAREAANQHYQPPIKRTPYFCSGCPHNSSTKVPEGSRALAGIGCHIMALWMERETESFTQMGGEGVTWVGEAPFTEEKHIFANLGDGTYFHSGILAIRQAVAAKVNITYKILFNDAVAMTGGQHVDGDISVAQMAAQLVAEGVARLVVVTEDVARYKGVDLPDDVALFHRDQLPVIQKQFRETAGCTVIIYDQTCAAEKRRRRKRGRMVDPDKRLFINSAVCEGCGDCSVQSNCVAVEPLETIEGRKRRINQSSCNKDYSCVKGFCPSFVEVSCAEIRKADPATLEIGDIAPPQLPEAGHGYNIMLTGIGGTGVLTISALMAMAAFIEGKASTTADMAGLAQKGGAVYSHVRIAEKDEDLLSPRIIAGGADLLLACDAVVAADRVAQNLMQPARTAAVVNADMAPTSDFVRHRDLDFHRKEVEAAIRANANPNATLFIHAEEVARQLLGDAIGANMLMLGAAYQQGLIPLRAESIDAAIVLNGVAVAFNRKAFALGRLMVDDPARVAKMMGTSQPREETAQTQSYDALVVRFGADLISYQNAAYAARYRDALAAVRAADLALGQEQLSTTAARALYKLMAYKDEYEVARLYSDGRFKAELDAQFSKSGKMHVYLSPPLLARTDPATGRPRKYRMGAWIFPLFRLLAKGRALRGTWADIFGYSEERKAERAAIADYLQTLTRLSTEVNAQNYALAVEIAALPLDVRGFGPVKAKAVAEVAKRAERLWARFVGGAGQSA